jgi:hypothetical protein
MPANIDVTLPYILRHGLLVFGKFELGNQYSIENIRWDSQEYVWDNPIRVKKLNSNHANLLLRDLVEDCA